MKPAVDCRELPFPASARKLGQVDQHAFSVATLGFSIGILYAREPFMENEKLGVHISISHTAGGRPRKVTEKVLTVVRRLIEQQGLHWPERHDVDYFEGGPFAGLGVHLWEADEIERLRRESEATNG